MTDKDRTVVIPRPSGCPGDRLSGSSAVGPLSRERNFSPHTASPTFFAQSGHPSNRARDSFFGHPEEILLVFKVTDEHARLDPDERLLIESTDAGRDVKIVELRKFPRSQFMVTVP